MCRVVACPYFLVKFGDNSQPYCIKLSYTLPSRVTHASNAVVTDRGVQSYPYAPDKPNGGKNYTRISTNECRLREFVPKACTNRYNKVMVPRQFVICAEPFTVICCVTGWIRIAENTSKLGAVVLGAGANNAAFQGRATSLSKLPV